MIRPQRVVHWLLLCSLASGCSAEGSGEIADPQDAGASVNDMSQLRQDASETPSDASLPSQCDEPTWTLDASRINVACGAALVALTPSVHIDGSWRNPSDCRASGGNGILCEFGAFGTLTVNVEPPQISATYLAGQAHEYGGHGLKGTARLEEVDGWLSNGFQSWSQSGVIQIPTQVTDREVESALSLKGDIEVIRSGYTNSWWHTYIHGPISLVAGATSAEVYRSWISVSGRAPNLSIRLASGGSGESIAAQPGQVLNGEGWFLDLTEAVNPALARYGSLLPTRTESQAVPEAGWNSWYEMWNSVDEGAVRENAALARAAFEERLTESALPLRIVIDDGWQKAWGDWTANEKFPSGLTRLASDLKADGFHTGIWLAPLLVSSRLELVEEHPEWFVEGASYTHLLEGEMKILDVSHPEAAEHLRSQIRRVVEQGFDLLKIDFLFAGSYEGGRFEDLTGIQAYNRAMSIIRESAGPETVILAVGAPPIAGFESVDAWRLGPDVAVEAFGASWFFIPGVGRTTAARWPFCTAVLCDGDPPILRELTENEVDVSGWAAAFAGGALFLSDDLRGLPAERLNWLTSEMIELALSGEVARPDPLPPQVPETLTTALSDQTAQLNRHHVPARWTLPSGGTVLVNWSDEPLEVDGVTYPPRTATHQAQ